MNILFEPGAVGDCHAAIPAAGTNNDDRLQKFWKLYPWSVSTDRNDKILISSFIISHCRLIMMIILYSSFFKKVNLIRYSVCLIGVFAKYSWNQNSSFRETPMQWYPHIIWSYAWFVSTRTNSSTYAIEYPNNLFEKPNSSIPG